MATKLSKDSQNDDQGYGAMTRRGAKKTGSIPSAPRRSPRFNDMAKPSAAIIAAKRNAKLKNANKKIPELIIKDIYYTARESKEMSRQGTGIVYDERMSEHRCLWDSSYPECPERFTRVLERCETLGLLSRCEFIEPREATENEILVKHTLEQIDILRNTENCQDETSLEKLSSRYDAIYIHPSTYRLSLLSAGSTIQLVDAICKGSVQNGMAVVRPPGHHAMKSEYCGYCFFNNVAIAASHALKHHNLSRVLIVDWDVHHGQATQQMFYDDPRVVYFSIHRYEHGAFWPNLRESDYHYVGEGKGAGYNFNVPLNATGMADAEYLAIFHQVLLPMATEFQPELIIISAGYDAAIGCPEGEMEVTPACYAHLLSSLLGLANGKVAVVLEGGYCLKSLAEGAALSLRTLLGDPCPALPAVRLPNNFVRDTILNVIYSHRDYWQCFHLQETYSINSIAKSSSSNDKFIKSPDFLTDGGLVRHLPTVKFLGSETKVDYYATRDCYPMQSQEFLLQVDCKLNLLIANTKLSFAPNRVCLVYDERMLKHKNIDDPSHPEKPERISRIFSCHEEFGLLKRCLRLESRVVTEEELLLLHSKDHVNFLKSLSTMKIRELCKKQEDFPSVYLHPESYESASIAAGCVLQVVDSVLNGESQSGVAIVRPPGHHAEQDEPCGFCMFNNVSLAAKYAIEVHGLTRVLLLDWDIHHGNGSQHLFESDPRVLYVSLHRYDNGSFFPNSKDANYTMVGTGAGEGYNVNIPWNKRGMSDGDYLAAFHQVVLPICYQFNPQLVLVSAGFDAAVGDPLGGYKVTPEAYGHMTHLLSSLSNGQLVLCLEGGYNVATISYAMTMCTKALLGDPLPALQPRLHACPSAVTSIRNVLHTHCKYWPGLRFQAALPQERVLPRPGRDEPLSPDVSLEESLSKMSLSLDRPRALCTEDREESPMETSSGSFATSPISSLSYDDSSIEEMLDSVTLVSTEEQNVNMTPCNVKNESNVGALDGSSKKVLVLGQPVTGRQVADDQDRDGSSRNWGQGSSQEGSSRSRGGASQPDSLVDYLSANLPMLLSGQMFAVVPLRGCPHLEAVQEVPNIGIDSRGPCLECGSTAENWVCLICYTIHCGRYINEHMMMHGTETEHPLTLSFSDLSVWCYPCEAYIDNLVLYNARNAVHRNKFGEDLPWSYGE